MRTLTALVLLTAVAAVSADEETVRPNKSNGDNATAAERAVTPDGAVPFSQGLNGKLLVGSYTMDVRVPNGGTVVPEAPPLRTDRYRIGKVMHVGGDQYSVEARVTYGEVDMTIPVPVTVRYAGKTPVLSLENLNIPLMGEDFGAKILFDFESGRYAGTWSHGEVGGPMWGRIVDPGPATGDKAEPTEKQSE